MNDVQGFDGIAGTMFAVPTGSVPYWSLDGACSPAPLFRDGTRGDGGSSCLAIPQTVPTGTRMLRDLNPGSGSTTFDGMAISTLDVISRLFFSADDGSGTTGQELYRIVDQAHGPVILEKDIQPGANGSNPMDLFQHAPGATGNIYFSADDGVTGRELWKSVTANTLVVTDSFVADINPGSASSNPSGFSAAVYLSGTPPTGTKVVVFTADDGSHGRELWVTSGAGPTTMLADINTSSPTASSDPQLLTTVNVSTNTDVKTFFTADNGVNGRELWRTDGSIAGTGMCKDIVAGAVGSDPSDLVSVSLLVAAVKTATLLFTVDSDGSGGRELWKSNGKLDGTDTLQVFDPGTSASPTNLTAANGLNVLFFTIGSDLWKSDGTLAGTVLVKSFAAPPGRIIANGPGTAVFFAADDGSGTGVELWTATLTGATLVKDIVPGSGTSSPQNLCAVGSTIFFSAADGTNGRELWRTDATVGALMVKDINPGAADSAPEKLISFSGTLIFTADDGTHGRELWQSDGSPTRVPNGINYKWDIASLIASKTGDPARNVVVGTDAKPLSMFWLYDLPAMGGGSGVSEAAHQINTYAELTDGVDRAPLNVTDADCGDGNLPRPKAALTDGTIHKAVAFGLVAVLDQNPCDTDTRGPGSPGVPFAYVPSVYDGQDWIPMDLAHIPAGVPTDPPSGPSLAQGPWSAIAVNATLPAGLVAATTDPWATKRFCQVRIDVWTGYIRVVFASKQTNLLYVATIPRKYNGGFKAAYVGNPACQEPAYPFYLDTVRLTGGDFTDSVDPFGACCGPIGCSEVLSPAECPIGTFSPWATCSQPGYICCPMPWADSDRDGDVDTVDFAVMQRCLSDTQVTTDCYCLDHNHDTKIDQDDVLLFVNCASGPGILTGPTPPDCN